MAVQAKNNKQKSRGSLTSRGPAGPAVSGGLALAAIGAAGHLAHLPPVYGVGGGVVCGLATVVTAAHQRAVAPAAICYRLAVWAGAGTWLGAALATSPWYPRMLAALGTGAAAAAICAPFGRTPRRRPAAPGTQVLVAGGGHIGRQWQARIARVCRISVRVTDVTRWDTRTGYNLVMNLPIGGASVDHLARHTKALASDARLPRGCRVDVAEGDHQGQAVMRVPTVNRLLADLPYERDFRPRSILDGIDIGEYPDATHVVVPLREKTALAVGMNGSGKTTVQDAFTGGVGLCRDALVWHIDLNGGGMSWAWLQPWLDGQTDRPAVDWAAPTVEEAHLMARTAYAIALDRKGTAHHLKVAANQRLMPICASLPEIVIVADEGKTLLSTNARGAVAAIRDLLTKIQDESRDAAVRMVTSALRATRTAIDTDFKAQVGVKIGMSVEDDSELAYLFDWGAKLRTRDLPTMGCAYVQYDQQPPRMFKSRHILPDDIHATAVAIARDRPDLDEAARAIGGELYASRYERMREYFRRPGNGQPAIPAHQAPAPARTGRARRPALTVPHGGGAGDGWANPGDVIEQARQARRGHTPVLTGTLPPPPAPATTARGPHTPHAIGRYLAGGHSQPLPKLLRRVLEVFAELEDRRVHSEVLADRLGITKDRLAALLRPLGVKPLPGPFERGGRPGRGYAAEHIEDACARIRSGELTVPPEVAAWPAA
jgi:hypothetical protein